MGWLYRIALQINSLLDNDISVGNILEIDKKNNKSSIRISASNKINAHRILPYRTPFNNVTIGIKRKFFNSIGGYGEARVGEDWVLSGKIIKETVKVDIKDKILVSVNIKNDFISRREGRVVYGEIKKSLEKLHSLGIIKLHELMISKAIQKVSRIYLSKIFLKLIYKLNRIEINR